MNDTMTRRMGALLAGAAAVVAFGIGGSAHADNGNSNGKGANMDGPYSSQYQSGGPSANGNGNGKAVGRPEAGSVGNADDKNPPGQDPYNHPGTDGNAGYECDTNSGVAQGNPAHSTCNDYYGGGANS
jgi:hypothetical protein